MKRVSERIARASMNALASTSTRGLTSKRALGGDAERAPTYGERDAFFVGVSDKGRGAYAARGIDRGEVILRDQNPLACHRTLANARTRCGRCLRETADGAFCVECEANAEREFAAFERQFVDMSAIEAYCERRGGLKFPLLCARVAAKILSGSLDEQTLEWLCYASNVGDRATMPPQWIEESIALASAFAGADAGLITPEWYAGVTTRLHLNAFRVEIPPALTASASTSAWRRAMSSSLDAIARGRASGTAIYVLPSLFNHSCEPNVAATWESSDARLTARALVDIPPGHELAIAYVDVDVDVHARARALEPYGFACACARCVVAA